MISYSDVENTLAEWHEWRNLDHRLLNDGNPSKLSVSVDLFVMEQDVDLVIRDLRLALMSKDDIQAKCNYDKLLELIKDYQQRVYVNVLKSEY